MVDDTPVTGRDNTVAMYVTAHYVIDFDDDTGAAGYLYGVSQLYGSYPLPMHNVTLPANGVVKMDLDIPSNATRLDVRVSNQ
jgi:hypothetical protein